MQFNAHYRKQKSIRIVVIVVNVPRNFAVAGIQAGAEPGANGR